MIESGFMKLTNKQTYVLMAVCGVVAAAALGGYLMLRDSGRDVDLGDKTKLRDYIASEEFKEMPRERQRRFFRKLRSDEFQKRLEEYSRLTEEQKKQYLDTFIDMMEKRRKAMEKKEGEEAARKKMRRRMDPERMRARSEKRSPEQRAQRAEFFNDLKNRMEERGMDPPFK